MMRILRTLAALGLLLTGCAARLASEEVAQLAEALQLRPGMRVADVGAGKGEWSEELARKVGPSGHVFATEVEEDRVSEIRERLDDAGLDNVTTILGGQLETGLPEACCDAILLRLVYHHFTEPRRMLDDLRRALRSGGRLVVVEITPQADWAELDGVPDRGGHGISPEDLLSELQAAGWTAVVRADDWGDEEDHYGVVFVDRD